MIADTISKIRTECNLTQAQFSEIFNVSQQTVQKWESGQATPSLDKIILIAKYFDISLDMLVLGNDQRIVEEMSKNRRIKPQYQNFPDREFYAANLAIEYQQCLEEGLDIEKYKDLFQAVAKLPRDETKKKLGDVLFELVMNAGQKEGYPYYEPSDLEQIQQLRRGWDAPKAYDASLLENKIHGAWLGRICGCMLGKSVEGIRTHELIPFLQETGNYPMHRYILRSDLKEDIVQKYTYPLTSRPYADEIDGMPVDDDTNYVVLAQKVIAECGKDFTPYDMSRAWMRYQPKDAYFTAEQVAFCNFVKGYEPPDSAVYQNPYREWVGAQIRGDYFGYINPGDPKMAAEMAWRDASISHIKNGIYGEMFAAAMLAVAAVTDDLEEIILGGLAEIPPSSRLHEDITAVLHAYKTGVSQQDCFRMIHEKYNEHTQHGWCHTISNAMIVAAALLYGGGDYGKSICMAVETGFDTDCNGATVGSVLGMAFGRDAIPVCWSDPIRNTLHTSIFGVGTVKITDCVKTTMEHIEKSKQSGAS